MAVSLGAAALRLRAISPSVSVLPRLFMSSMRFDATSAPGVGVPPTGVRERVREDLKVAFKDKELKNRLSVLRAISTAITYADKDSGKAVDDIKIASLLRAMLDRHKESVDMYQQAGPAYQDRLALEQAQMDVIREYLPKEVAHDVLVADVTRIIQELKATTLKDMGAVIREVGRLHGSAAPNSVVAPIVKAALAPQK